MASHLQQRQQKMNRDKTQVTCHQCDKKGHYANELEKCHEREKDKDGDNLILNSVVAMWKT